MVRKVCKNDPLVERNVYTRSESDPKYPLGSSRIKMVQVREEVVRANEEGPRARRGGPCMTENGSLTMQQ